jgi:tetratricopeptide (TPR) repeat protein
MNSKRDRYKIEELAKKYVNRGKLQEAAEEYKKLLSGNKKDIPIRNIIGDLYVKSNQKRKAIKEFYKIADLYEEMGLCLKSIAILRRIRGLNPEDLEPSKKLAVLYHEQGLTSQAKAEYLELAKALEKKKKSKDAIQMYEKLLKISPDEMGFRIALVALYTQEGMVEEAVEELNNVAEFKIGKHELKDAHIMLTQARELNAGCSRTLINLVDLFKRENKRKEALDLANEMFAKDKDNIKALYLLGDLYFEDRDLKRAEDIFSRIISLRPEEVSARVKLGRIFIQDNQLDKAFELYEPLVDTLVRKQKEEKAIGLLGLILAAKKAHLSTLEKLAALFRAKGQKKSLEIVDKVILEELRKNNLREKMLCVLEELVNLSPYNKEYYSEFRQLDEELRSAYDEPGIDQASFQVDDVRDGEVIVEKDKEIIEATLAKADSYIKQGLARDAKRILDEARISKKIDEVKDISTEVQEDEVFERVEDVIEKNGQINNILDTSKIGESPELHQEIEEEKFAAAEIFAEAGIVPLASQRSVEKKYFDLAEKIEDELEAIKDVHYYQINGDATIAERALPDIVSDFFTAVREKVDEKDYDSHYNLGIAFLEQGLLDEAIEECKLASQSQKLKIDSCSIISCCFRQKKDFLEALKWLEKAQKQTEEGSSQFFAIKYELASLYEEKKDIQKALLLFQEVKEWNIDYRDVSEKTKLLEIYA